MHGRSAILAARDFALSKSFYEAMGFVMELDTDEVAIFRIGASSFLLQNHFQNEWAENSMMQLLAEDLDGWWRHLVSLNLPAAYGVPERRPGVGHDR